MSRLRLAGVAAPRPTAGRGVHHGRSPGALRARSRHRHVALARALAPRHGVSPIPPSASGPRAARPGSDELRADGAAQDVRFALRLFRKHPTSSGIAIVGLAVAIAVAVSVFTVVDAVMLRPYGMDDPASVVSVGEPRHGWALWPYSSFLKIQEAATLARVEASMSPKVRFSQVATPGTESNRRARFVSGGYLAMLGGRPVLGRPIGPHDDVAGAPPVIMVSHQLWSTALDADPAAIGRTMWLNGTPVTLVGVMSPEFTGPSRSGGPAIWAPLAAFDDVLGGKPLTRTSNELVEVVARLAPSASPRALEDNLTSVVHGWHTATTVARASAASGSKVPPRRWPGGTRGIVLTILFVFGIVGLGARGRVREHGESAPRSGDDASVRDGDAPRARREHRQACPPDAQREPDARRRGRRLGIRLEHLARAGSADDARSARVSSRGEA